MSLARNYRVNFVRAGFLGCLFAGAVMLPATVQAWQDGQASNGGGAETAGGTNGRIVIHDATSLERIDVHIGSSRVISAPWPVARVSVNDPDIADVQVPSPHQVVVTGRAQGTTDLVMWSGDNQMWQARIYVMVDLSYINDELKRLFPDAELQVVQSRDMIVVQGFIRRTEQVAQIRAILEAYEVKYIDATSVAGVHQVQLHIRVAEVSREAIRALTMNFIYDGENFRAASLIGPAGGTPLISGAIPSGDIDFGTTTTLIGEFPGADLSMFLEALAQNQFVRILAEPSLIALSGEEASFLAGGEFPIPVVQGGAGEDSNTSITIEYKEFGVRLAFRPVVLGDNTIRLFVAPEVSDLSDFGAVEISGFRIPSLLTRRSETTMELRSGQTFAMAGLLNQNTRARSSRIPLLGDLPVLGPLFRSVRYTEGETELLILVTASLVEPMNQDANLVMPGDTHAPPNDWEFYIDGRLEGIATPLDPADAEWLREKGLNRLKGPGAWTTHEQPIAYERGSAAEASEPADEETPE